LDLVVKLLGVVLTIVAVSLNCKATVGLRNCWDGGELDIVAVRLNC